MKISTIFWSIAAVIHFLCTIWYLSTGRLFEDYMLTAITVIYAFFSPLTYLFISGLIIYFGLSESLKH